MTEDLVKWEDRHPVSSEPDQAQQTDLVLVAMQKGYDPALISQMMDLRDREEKRQALQAYIVAMSRAKKNMPEIEKDKHVKFETQKGTTEYYHSSLANICKKAVPILSAEGLHASWKPSQSDGIISVECVITHEKGHSESVQLRAAPDITGNKNSIQAVGSTISYLERYTLLALLGLATSDMDDDGKGSDTSKFITEEQAIEIDKLVTESGADAVSFMGWIGVEKYNDIPVKKYKEAVTFLKAKKANKEKK